MLFCVAVSDIVINSHTHQKEIRKPLYFLLNCLLLDQCHLIVDIQEILNHLPGYYHLFEFYSRDYVYACAHCIATLAVITADLYSPKELSPLPLCAS